MQISSKGQSIARSDHFEKLFCELYTRQRKTLYERAYRIVQRRDVAEDICQEVFAKLWAYKEKYEAVVEDYAAFLFRMVHNEAINYVRKEKIAQQVIQHIKKQSNVPHNLTEEILYQKELEVLLHQAINQLSPKRKTIYLLCKIEGLEYSKAAHLLGKSVCTVREMMRLSNQQIRKFINSQMQLKCKKKAEHQKHTLLLVKALNAA